MPKRKRGFYGQKSGKRGRSVKSKGIKGHHWRKGYGKRAKRRMAKRRAPFVEMKTVQSNVENKPLQVNAVSVIEPQNFTVHVPSAWSQFLTQGTDDFQIIGRSCVSKYLALKVTLDFSNMVQGRQLPNDLRIIQGWLKENPEINTLDQNLTTSQPTLNLRYETSIAQQARMAGLAGSWLDFVKPNRNIKILRNQRVQPNANGRLQYNQVDTAKASPAPPVNYHFKWKMPGKEYLRGSTTASLQKVNSWVPFIACFCAEFSGAEALGDRPLVPAMGINETPILWTVSKYYYTDS